MSVAVDEDWNSSSAIVFHGRAAVLILKYLDSKPSDRTSFEVILENSFHDQNIVLRLEQH